MANTDFNTEGPDAKFGVQLRLSNENTTTYWYATRAKQKKKLINGNHKQVKINFINL